MRWESRVTGQYKRDKASSPCVHAERSSLVSPRDFGLVERQTKRPFFVAEADSGRARDDHREVLETVKRTCYCARWRRNCCAWAGLGLIRRMAWRISMRNEQIGENSSRGGTEISTSAGARRGHGRSGAA